jgi:hypothetical protein
MRTEAVNKGPLNIRQSTKENNEMPKPECVLYSPEFIFGI